MVSLGLSMLRTQRRPVCDVEAFTSRKPVIYDLMKKPVEANGTVRAGEEQWETQHSAHEGERPPSSHSSTTVSSASASASSLTSSSSSASPSLSQLSEGPRPKPPSIPEAPPLPTLRNGIFVLDGNRLAGRLSRGQTVRKLASTPNFSTESSDMLSIITKTTTNISIRSPSSGELLNRLSRLSNRMPCPTPIYIQSIKIDLGDGRAFDNFEDAINAIRTDDRSQATITVVAIGGGEWESEVSRAVQEGSQTDRRGRSLGPVEPALATRRSASVNGRSNVRCSNNGGDDEETEKVQLCAICGSDRDVKTMFTVPTPQCVHQPRCCKICVEMWVKSLVDAAGGHNIFCPDVECDKRMGHADIVKALSYSPKGMESLDRFEYVSLRMLLSTMDSFKWCLSTSCESGQFHDPADGPIVTCVSCGFRSCAEHDLPWHEGQTCDEYDRWRLLSLGRTHNEERMYRVARKLFLSMKDCPNCYVTIQKFGGCDHMQCTSCRTEFCYRCRICYDGPQGIWARGRSAHSITCRHYWAGIPWRLFRH